MDVMFERVAGLDVGKASVTVCVRTPALEGKKRRSQTRTFSTTARSLVVMADWLVDQGVTLAAMESTATYWKPIFYCLEERMECWLLNVAHMKAVPGRKSDVKDAEWIAQLLEHGPVRPSFVPPPDIRRLRNLTANRRCNHTDIPAIPERWRRPTWLRRRRQPSWTPDGCRSPSSRSFRRRHDAKPSVGPRPICDQKQYTEDRRADSAHSEGAASLEIFPCLFYEVVLGRRCTDLAV